MTARAGTTVTGSTTSTAGTGSSGDGDGGGGDGGGGDGAGGDGGGGDGRDRQGDDEHGGDAIGGGRARSETSGNSACAGGDAGRPPRLLAPSVAAFCQRTHQQRQEGGHPTPPPISRAGHWARHACNNSRGDQGRQCNGNIHCLRPATPLAEASVPSPRARRAGPLTARGCLGRCSTPKLTAIHRWGCTAEGMLRTVIEHARRLTSLSGFP